jgi:hypothetical protein
MKHLGRRVQAGSMLNEPFSMGVRISRKASAGKWLCPCSPSNHAAATLFARGWCAGVVPEFSGGSTRNFPARWPIETYAQTDAIRPGARPRRNHHANLSKEVAAKAVPRAHDIILSIISKAQDLHGMTIHAFVFLSTHAYFLLSPAVCGNASYACGSARLPQIAISSVNYVALHPAGVYLPEQNVIDQSQRARVYASAAAARTEAATFAAPSHHISPVAGFAQELCELSNAPKLQLAFFLL